MVAWMPDPSAPEPQNRQQAAAYRFYQDWVSGKMGRVIIVLIQHPTPFYDDSYAVNSVNVGPYGDAIMQELIPEVETRFRAIGQPWARITDGGSTGDRPRKQLTFALDEGPRVAVGVDTGLTHLAAALGIPALGLYCGSSPALTGLRGSGWVRNLGAAASPPEVKEVQEALAMYVSADRDRQQQDEVVAPKASTRLSTLPLAS